MNDSREALLRLHNEAERNEANRTNRTNRMAIRLARKAKDALAGWTPLPEQLTLWSW